MENKQLVIMDFSSNSVLIEALDVKEYQSEEIENIIEGMGFRLKDVEWIITKRENIIV